MLRTRRRIGIAVGLLLGAAGLGAGPASGAGSADADTERFLAQAEIVDSVQLSSDEGVNRPFKLTLQADGVTRHALWKNPSGRIGGYVEGWKYEIAAYRLDRYLGLRMVPATVEREFDGRPGSCQVWTKYWKQLREIAAEKIPTPPERVLAYNRDVYLQRAFDNLIANVDRHLGNILVTEDWRFVLIDHSRAFRVGRRHTRNLIYTADHPEGPKLMKQLPRSFVERLEALSAETLDGVVGGYLTPKEKQAVLDRKLLVLRDIRAQIEADGEDQVLY